LDANVWDYRFSTASSLPALQQLRQVQGITARHENKPPMRAMERQRWVRATTKT